MSNTSAMLDVAEILRSPLAQSGSPGQFLRLVLAQAASFGMDGKSIALLDDVAAMLGYYNPLSPGQAAHLAGPLVNWRTHPNQPTYERVRDVEKLVFKQRALLAFGGGEPGQMVGTAEIVVACGNIMQGTMPSEYYEVFTWASLDVLSILTGDSKETILKDPGKKDWKLILDDEVLRPSGRLYKTYQEMATSIRRDAIENLRNQEDDPRRYLRPVAALFVESHRKVKAEAVAEGLTGLVERLDGAIGVITTMYPDLQGLEAEAFRQTAERGAGLD